MIEPTGLLDMDFSLSGIYVKQETWDAGCVHDYLVPGRTGNLLHYIIDGSRTYEIHGGERTLRAGSVILIPNGTPYRTETRQSCSGIGICFDIFRSDGTPISLLHDLFSVEDIEDIFSGLFFEMLQTQTGRGMLLHRKTLLWQLLDRMLSMLDAHSQESIQLAPGILFIQQHYRKTYRFRPMHLSVTCRKVISDADLRNTQGCHRSNTGISFVFRKQGFSCPAV